MDLIIALTFIEGFLILLAIATYKAIRFISPSLHIVDESCKGQAASVSTVSSSSDIAAAATLAINQQPSLDGIPRIPGPRPKLIKKIVEDILSKLNYCVSSSFHLEGLVGINDQIEKIEELLIHARIVGIWGIGGIGKTTLARAVFHNLKAQFEASSFVGNVREQIARIGLNKLMEECLKELLKDEGLHIYNMKSTFVKHRLQHKKILPILDDVDNLLRAEDLTYLCDWFGEGSRIIVTSRDLQVLKNASALMTYHVQKLEFSHALNLFSLKAFKQNEPFISYLELSKLVVGYCQGNPLALVVLGCFLYGRTKEMWESALEKLKQAPHNDIFSVLKLSFDGLNEKQKNVFLDLAHLVREKSKTSLSFVRGFYDFSVYIEISVLKERSLILMDQFGEIEMHDLVREMGQEICRQQLIIDLKKPIRLWKHNDIYHFFINNKGSGTIRHISLDTSKTKEITLKANAFHKMKA
ncbi:hypothetical protein K1719_001902 [Acacia pycnantha]|nr:hypothetical protein K1719_001902 [Acacia pycnantha]